MACKRRRKGRRASVRPRKASDRPMPPRWASLACVADPRDWSSYVCLEGRSHWHQNGWSDGRFFFVRREVSFSVLVERISFDSSLSAHSSASPHMIPMPLSDPHILQNRFTLTYLNSKFFAHNRNRILIIGAVIRFRSLSANFRSQFPDLSLDVDERELSKFKVSTVCCRILFCYSLILVIPKEIRRRDPSLHYGYGVLFEQQSEEWQIDSYRRCQRNYAWHRLR